MCYFVTNSAHKYNLHHYFIVSVNHDFFIDINGQIYISMFKRHPRSTLYRSLEKALTHPSSASSAWMENHDSDFLRLRASPNDNSLYWVDKDDHVLSLAFPAILDPEKTYNEIESYNVLNDMKVRLRFHVHKIYS